MLNTISQLTSAVVSATDGDIGHVTAAFFDDQTWTVRYVVVDTGNWLSGRLVLISPYAVSAVSSEPKSIAVSLTREQVRNSPDIDTHKPVSRQHEQEYLNYYAYPEYWDGGALWAMGALPLLPAASPSAVGAGPEPRGATAHGDTHLRSSDEVKGYDIQAADDSIGHVQDFVFDVASWAIRYLVVDTRNWWPGGRKVLVSTRWIDRIDWAEQKVYTPLTRAQVKDSPAYDDLMVIHRDYETRLHKAFGRQGYWD